MNIFCDTTQFPSWEFFGPHKKPHGVRGFNKHDHMWFYPKLWHGICAILQIPCACYECMYMLDKPCTPVLSPQQQPCYQPVFYFKFCPVLGCFNKFNIITFPYKAMTSKDFEEIRQVVLYGMSDNMASLVQFGKYVAMWCMLHSMGMG